MSPQARWDLYGLAAGLGSGLFDLALFWLLGAELHLGGRPTALIVTTLFALTCGALGYTIGRLVMGRVRERSDAETIQRQLRALADSQRQALQNEKLAAIGRLAAGIAHEVRNPLGVIRASASMLMDGFLPGEDSHRACSFICEEIDRLNGLITSLLGFARPAPLKVQRVQVDEAIERALSLCADEIGRRGIAVDREGAAGLAVDADPDLLSQLLLGIVTNAAEAMAAGGRLVVRVGQGDGELRLEIADSGPGIPPENAARIFEPFFTTKARGTGLGLAMALRIAQAHRGALASVAGRGAGSDGSGACFELRLPIFAGPELRGGEALI